MRSGVYVITDTMRSFYFKYNIKLSHIASGRGIVTDVHITRTLDECELFLMIDGVANIRQGNEEYVLNKGDYLLTERNIEYGGSGPMSGEFHWLHFAYHDGEAFFADEPPVGEYLQIPKRGHLCDGDALSVLDILIEQYAKNDSKKAVTDALVRALLIDLSKSVDGVAAPRSKDKRFQPIIDYFHCNPHINDFHDVKGMAEFFGYNERYLIRLFKKNTGMSPHEYLTEKKILRAQEMLADSNMAIKEIAGILNYDYYYFMRLFRKATGMSPTEFRKRVIPDWGPYVSQHIIDYGKVGKPDNDGDK